MIRAWTDEEMGVIAARPAEPAEALARELGRSADAIYKARARVRKGWTRERESWSKEDDAFIMSAPTHLTASQMASRLPGRTMEAVKHRRRTLGAPHSQPGDVYSPNAIGTRPLIAKTCRKCGHLLPGEKFYSRKGRAGYLSECAYCIAEHTRAWKEKNPDRDNRAPGEKAEAMRRWNRRMREATAAGATRSGMPYLEADFEVLANPRLSLMAKALALKRTYAAVSNVCASHSYASSIGANHGHRSDAAWSIDNPNADRIEEITAALKQEFTDACVTFPAWDWDDEYTTKETAA